MIEDWAMASAATIKDMLGPYAFDSDAFATWMMQRAQVIYMKACHRTSLPQAEGERFQAAFRHAWYAYEGRHVYA